MNNLFVCTKCQHVDAIDIARSEWKLWHDMPGSNVSTLKIPYERFVCTQCLTTHWHGYFPYLPYDPQTDQEVVNPPLPTN